MGVWAKGVRHSIVLVLVAVLVLETVVGLAEWPRKNTKDKKTEKSHAKAQRQKPKII